MERRRLKGELCQQAEQHHQRALQQRALAAWQDAAGLQRVGRSTARWLASWVQQHCVAASRARAPLAAKRRSQRGSGGLGCRGAASNC